MSSGRLEILVEPFRENDPGPHVIAVVDLLTNQGFTVDMGPFSTTAEGDLADLVAAVGDLMTAGFRAGASSIQTRLELA